MYHPEHVRVAALLAFYLAGTVIYKAVKQLHQLLPEDEFDAIREPRAFIRYQVKKFLKFKTLRNLLDTREPGVQKKVPDGVVMDCIVTLKAGYQVLVPLLPEAGGAGINAPTTPQHMWYTSIEQACKHNPKLAKVCSDYGVTPKYLQQRMHQMDPKLKRRTLDIKHPLSAQHMADRQRVAAYLSILCLRYPKWLYQVWWIDETSIWIIKTGTAKVKVYCEAHDADVRAVLTSPHLGTHNAIKVHLFAAVNALLGPCFYDFTTGTTNLQRRYNLARAPYKVGGVGSSQWYPLSCTLTQPANSSCMWLT